MSIANNAILITNKEDEMDKARDITRKGMKKVAFYIDKITKGKITPNQVSIIGLLLHIPIVFFMVDGQYILSAFLLVAFGLLDTLDGELARLQKRVSYQGAILDASIDRIKEVMIYAVFVYIFASQGNALAATLAITALGGAITVSYIKAKGETALISVNKNINGIDANKILANGFARFEVRILIVVLGLMLNQIYMATILVALLSWMTVFYRFFIISRKLPKAAS